MTIHRLSLNDEMDEDFTLLAIHCSEEAYKLAYLINRQLRIQLKRRISDLDFSTDGLLITFPIYYFEDARKYIHFSLVANKCKSVEATLQSSGGLFSEIVSERALIKHLLPEFKKVDYFLKIYSDFETVPLRKIISDINDIKQVISAYAVETANIKSKNNLIFD